MNKQILIRVDGNAQIGQGHIVRCIALAHMLKNHFKIYVYSIYIPNEYVLEFEKTGIEVFKIESEAQFLSQITENQIVVLDGYGFDAIFQKKIKEFKIKLVCIDDAYNGEFFADVLLNHSLGADQKKYKVQNYTKFALGLNYSLLRPCFLKAINIETKKKKNSLVVNFGVTS